MTSEPHFAPGDAVEIKSKSQGSLFGTVISCTSDDDSFMANPEDWLRIRMGKDEFVFRKPMNWRGNWSAQARSLKRRGYLQILKTNEQKL